MVLLICESLLNFVCLVLECLVALIDSMCIEVAGSQHGRCSVGLYVAGLLQAYGSLVADSWQAYRQAHYRFAAGLFQDCCRLMAGSCQVYPRLTAGLLHADFQLIAGSPLMEGSLRAGCRRAFPLCLSGCLVFP